MPHIMTVPEVNPGLPVIRGGQVDGNMTAPAPSGDMGAQSSTQSDRKVDSSTTSSNDNAEMSLDERAQKRTDELLQSDGKGLEDLMIDREIEDTVPQKGRRLTIRPIPDRLKRPCIARAFCYLPPCEKQGNESAACLRCRRLAEVA